MSIKFVENGERKQKGDYGYRTEHKTRSTHNTGRKTGREESIHTRHRLIKTGKQTRKVREGDRGYCWFSAKVGDSHSGNEDSLTGVLKTLRGNEERGCNRITWFMKLWFKSEWGSIFMKSSQGCERARSWRTCRSFWWAPLFFPPLFLALGLFASTQRASQRGQHFNIFTWFIEVGGFYLKKLSPEGSGLPVRDCAASPNNRDLWWPKLSTIDVTAKAIFECLYLVSGLVPICALCHYALGAHTPTAHATTISRYAIFSRVVPQYCNFFPSGPSKNNL